MAGSPTKNSKPAAAKDTAIRDIVIVLSIVLIFYVSTNITPISVDSIISGKAPTAVLAHYFDKVDLMPIQNFFIFLQNLLTVFGLLFFAGSVWATLKIREIHHAEHEKYAPVHVEEVTAQGKMIQWKVILEHATSESPAEWKLAILEADNMLDEILEDMGYEGDTLAEKLKKMSPNKIASYNDIWDAHKLRNEIAHGGAIDMELTKKSARDTVAKFGNAFKELGYL